MVCYGADVLIIALDSWGHYMSHKPHVFWQSWKTLEHLPFLLRASHLLVRSTSTHAGWCGGSVLAGLAAIGASHTLQLYGQRARVLGCEHFPLSWRKGHMIRWSTHGASCALGTAVGMDVGTAVGVGVGAAVGSGVGIAPQKPQDSIQNTRVRRSAHLPFDFCLAQLLQMSAHACRDRCTVECLIWVAEGSLVVLHSPLVQS